MIELDAALFRLINLELTHPFIDPFMIAVTHAGTWYGLLGFLWAVWMWTGGPRQRRAGLVLLGVIAVSDSVATQVLKPLFQRPRPFLVLLDAHQLAPIQELSGFGLPSNHAANSFAFSVFVSLVYQRRAVVIPLIFLSTLICYSRVYVGVHYPGDVLLGAAWGAFVGWGGYRFFKRFCERRPVAAAAP